MYYRRILPSGRVSIRSFQNWRPMALATFRPLSTLLSRVSFFVEVRSFLPCIVSDRPLVATSSRLILLVLLRGDSSSSVFLSWSFVRPSVRIFLPRTRKTEWSPLFLSVGKNKYGWGTRTRIRKKTLCCDVTTKTVECFRALQSNIIVLFIELYPVSLKFSGLLLDSLSFIGSFNTTDQPNMMLVDPCLLFVWRKHSPNWNERTFDQLLHSGLEPKETTHFPVSVN